MIDYYNEPIPSPDDKAEAIEAVHILRENACNDAEYLEAMKTLNKYLKGV